jgi:hypothetical protein
MRWIGLIVLFMLSIACLTVSWDMAWAFISKHGVWEHVVCGLVAAVVGFICLACCVRVAGTALPDYGR